MKRKYHFRTGRGRRGGGVARRESQNAFIRKFMYLTVDDDADESKR